jgi:hypothetical protein
MSQGSVYRKNSSPQYAHAGVAARLNPRPRRPEHLRELICRRDRLSGLPRFSCEPQHLQLFGTSSSRSSARSPAAANATQAGVSISMSAKIGWLRSVAL